MSTDEYVPSEAELDSWMTRAYEAEKRAWQAEAERDRWHSMWRQRGVKHLAAEKRATRAEAQAAIRGRAVVMYRERAREAEARIEAVRDVHTGTVWPGVTDAPICDACDQPWPCATTRALDGTVTPPDAG